MFFIGTLKSQTQRHFLLTGEHHSHVGITLNNLATLYCKTGKYDDAEQLLQRSLGILKRSLPDSHAFIAVALSNLENVHLREEEGLVKLYHEQYSISKAETLEQSISRMKRKIPLEWEGLFRLANMNVEEYTVEECEVLVAMMKHKLREMQRAEESKKSVITLSRDRERDSYTLSLSVNEKERYLPESELALGKQVAVLPKIPIPEKRKQKRRISHTREKIQSSIKPASKIESRSRGGSRSRRIGGNEVAFDKEKESLLRSRSRSRSRSRDDIMVDGAGEVVDYVDSDRKSRNEKTEDDDESEATDLNSEDADSRESTRKYGSESKRRRKMNEMVEAGSEDRSDEDEDLSWLLGETLRRELISTLRNEAALLKHQ